MNITSGLLAVLNKDRQILAINETLMKMLGIEDAEKALGLRPGEAVDCVYSDITEGGCGTTEYCSSCGAAIAIVTSLSEDVPVQRTCAIKTGSVDGSDDLFIKVRACPIQEEDVKLILLFLQDISEEQRWAALGRVFFHDIANLTSSLAGATEMLREEAEVQGEAEELLGHIDRLAQRMKGEVEIQKHLVRQTDTTYRPLPQLVSSSSVILELKGLFTYHPAAQGRVVVFEPEDRETSLQVDLTLLLRVLGNMITNALEATPPGGRVRFWTDRSDDELTFRVWNAGVIRPDVEDRIFQRNISSKEEAGRGLGTYSMKLFGEKFLGGRVGFTTSEKDGTTFRLALGVR